MNEGGNRINIAVTATATNGDLHTTTYSVNVTRLSAPPPGPGERHLLAGSPAVPPGVGVGSQFRLLFVSSSSTGSRNANLSHYNNIVVGNANGGQVDIRPFGNQFRALVSTATVDARDNTDTRGFGVPIYWLGGKRVANTYFDFYDGSWDSRDGRDGNGNLIATDLNILTGSLESGVGQPTTRIGDRSGGVRTGRLDQGEGNEIDNGPVLGNNFDRLYGLSPVLTLLANGPQSPVVWTPHPRPERGCEHGV